MATGKENNMPITPLANALQGLMNRTNSPSFQPIPFAMRTNFDCSSPQKEKPVSTYTNTHLIIYTPFKHLLTALF